MGILDDLKKSVDKALKGGSGGSSGLGSSLNLSSSSLKFGEKPLFGGLGKGIKMPKIFGGQKIEIPKTANIHDISSNLRTIDLGTITRDIKQPLPTTDLRSLTTTTPILNLAKIKQPTGTQQPIKFPVNALDFASLQKTFDDFFASIFGGFGKDGSANAGTTGGFTDSFTHISEISDKQFGEFFGIITSGLGDMGGLFDLPGLFDYNRIVIIIIVIIVIIIIGAIIYAVVKANPYVRGYSTAKELSKNKKIKKELKKIKKKVK